MSSCLVPNFAALRGDTISFMGRVARCSGVDDLSALPFPRAGAAHATVPGFEWRNLLLIAFLVFRCSRATFCNMSGASCSAAARYATALSVEDG